MEHEKSSVAKLCGLGVWSRRSSQTTTGTFGGLGVQAEGLGMTKADAHKLLDRCRAGQNVLERQILEALQATGDLDFERQVTWRAAGEWSLPVGLAPAVWHKVLA